MASQGPATLPLISLVYPEPYQLIQVSVQLNRLIDVGQDEQNF